MSIDIEEFPCHDMTHPPEDRAPFCTQSANKANRVEGGPGLGPDMYFCDACFEAGSRILDQIMGHIERGEADPKEVLAAIKAATGDKPRDKN